MNVLQMSDTPPSALARALAEFEAPFTYPLGPARFFRISHGDDYTLFFRTIGEATCFIAERKGRVVGALGTAIRRLVMPDGSERSVAYIGDLKIATDARGGAVLARLARSAESWLRARVDAAYGVVMRGTALSPASYTGRAGIPAFQTVGRVVVLRLSMRGGSHGGDHTRFHADPEHGLTCYRRLSLGRYASPSADATKRSQITPEWLMNPDGTACGLIEDTRKAKRLIEGNGQELLTAHLSYFACRTAAAGSELIRVALRQLPRLGFPALFVAVTETEVQPLSELLPDVEILIAPAAVFGTGLGTGSWNINSAEI